MCRILIALFPITFLLCGSFSSAFISVHPARMNIAGLFKVIKSIQQEEKKTNDKILRNLEDIKKSLSNLEGNVREMRSDWTLSPKMFVPSMNDSTKVGVAVSRTVFEPRNLEYFKNCAELRSNGDLTSGVRAVYPYANNTAVRIEVFCDQETDGGGWTVFQNRDALPIRKNFTRTWDEYVKGFGDLNGEFWLGLENIHALTSSTPTELRVDLQDWDGERRWAKYGIFHVGDAASQYVLRIGNYSGDAGDTLTFSESRFKPHYYSEYQVNGMRFSTHDKDNDRYSGGNCAELYRGGWWFNDCHTAHLNGYPHVEEHKSAGGGINWNPFRGNRYSLMKTSMKIRPALSGET